MLARQYNEIIIILCTQQTITSMIENRKLKMNLPKGKR